MSAAPIQRQAAVLLRAEIDRRGLTQAMFAKMIGRTEKHVSQVLNGKAGSMEFDYWAFVLGLRFVLTLEATP